MVAMPGEELTCTARNHPTLDRGLISYYAGRTLAQSQMVGSWVSAMEALAAADRRLGLVTTSAQHALRVAGEPEISLPGRPVAVPSNTDR
jgi:hypothetical protein